MDHIILGLLFLKGRTIYQLRERIDAGLNLMYSSSMGSIQAGIKKLLTSGYIGYEETVENGKYKKVYHITESGKQAFLTWVNAPMEDVAVKCPGLIKLYFMGFSDRENRESSIAHYLTLLRTQYQTLNLLCEEAKQVAVPANGQEIFQYQLAAASYGRDFFQFHIQWFEQLLSKMRSEER